MILQKRLSGGCLFVCIKNKNKQAKMLEVKKGPHLAKVIFTYYLQ